VRTEWNDRKEKQGGGGVPDAEASGWGAVPRTADRPADGMDTSLRTADRPADGMATSLRTTDRRADGTGDNPP